MQKIKGKHIQVHVAGYNDAPKQDHAKLQKTSETISLLKKASNTIGKLKSIGSSSNRESSEVRGDYGESGAEGGLQSPTADNIIADVFHRIEVVSDDLQVPVRELTLPKKQYNDGNKGEPADSIELD